MDIKQKVNLLWENRQLEDCVTLWGSGITEGKIIQMVLKPDSKLKLNIQTFKKGNIAVELNDSSTPLDLLEALSSSTLKSTAKASDFYFGKTRLSDENLAFHFYGITDGDTLVQNYHGTFHIRLDDARTHGYIGFNKVMGKDTINAVPVKVLELINRSKGTEDSVVTEDDIVIFHVQKDCEVDTEEACVYHELDRETATVFQCDIKPNDI